LRDSLIAQELLHIIHFAAHYAILWFISKNSQTPTRDSRQLSFSGITLANTYRVKTCLSMTLYPLVKNIQTGKPDQVEQIGTADRPGSRMYRRAKSAFVAMHLLTSSLCFAAHACACCMQVWTTIYKCTMYAHTEYKRGQVYGVFCLKNRFACFIVNIHLKINIKQISWLAFQVV